MILHDSQIYMRIAGHREQCFGLNHIVGMEDELELLLVYGRGSQQGCLQATPEPLRGNTIGFIEVLHWFLRMLYARNGPVAQGDDAVNGVILSQ